MSDLCANCPVSAGECPVCRTFWVRKPDGKLYGVRPVTEQPKGLNLDTLDNVVPGNRQTAHTMGEWKRHLAPYLPKEARERKETP